MDREEFSALVSSGARCASACASIVYISARFHQVVGTGLLGIHTCYLKQEIGAPQPSSFCNEEIAQNAVDHGTSYGALQMLATPHRSRSNGMDWSRSRLRVWACADRRGFDHTLAVPSFDCKTAKLQSELAICANKRLARHEASLSKYYFQTIRSMPLNEEGGISS